MNWDWEKQEWSADDKVEDPMPNEVWRSRFAFALVLLAIAAMAVVMGVSLAMAAN